MYSEISNTKIRTNERNSFRKIKEIENRNKTIPKSDDILFTDDFTFKKFFHNGDSGELFLATNKHNKNEKYIIKHEYYDCACNEYMYSKIGNKIGVKIAPVKLFVVNDKDNQFKSDFVCGIKYFEDFKEISFDNIKINFDNWQDYYRMHCLESVFDESDGIELVKNNNYIYRIDTTDAFTISDYDISLLAYSSIQNGINIKQFASINILKKANRNLNYRISNWNFNINFFVKKFGQEYFDYYIDTLKLLSKIKEKDINEWTNTLTLFYPNIVGDYFKTYLRNLKLDIDEFIKINNKNIN